MAILASLAVVVISLSLAALLFRRIQARRKSR